MKRILRLVIVTALGCGAFPGLLSSANNAGFLDAVSFALTGSDKDIEVVDLQKCIFRTNDGTFYLNNVQVDRISLRKGGIIQPDGAFTVYTHLHGSSRVLDNRRTNQSAVLDFTISFDTHEYDRALKAWNFIYANGCTGKRSAF